MKGWNLPTYLFTFNHISLPDWVGRGLCLWKHHTSCFLFVCTCVSLWMSLFAFTYCKFWASWPALTKPFTDLKLLKATWHLLSTFLHWLTTIWRKRDIMKWEVGFGGSDRNNKRFCFLTGMSYFICGKGRRPVGWFMSFLYKNCTH
jgi:hypothetical protein